MEKNLKKLYLSKNRAFLKALALFLGINFFLVSCSNEYVDFHSQKKEYKESLKKVYENSPKKDVSEIEELSVEISNLPDKSALDKLIWELRNSKKRILLETYILTEKRIINELISAKKRGVSVKVILEKNVLWSPSINKKALELLNKSWIDAIYADSENYRFTHSKFFIIDDLYIIGTWNMSHSTFYKNKEFFVYGKDYDNLKILERVFDDDWIWKKSIVCEENIITSPFCSRIMTQNILSLAEKSVYMYEQQIFDSSTEEIIMKKASEWVKINIILENPKNVKSNENIIKKFKLDNINTYFLEKTYIHAKAIIVDESIIYIWSINMTSNSMDNNREVGLVFRNENKSKELIKQFNIEIGQ